MTYETNKHCAIRGRARALPPPRPSRGTPPRRT